jgi:hypothetical protein
LFEVTEALLCTDGPVKTLVGLSLAPQHRRGHGALYDRDFLIVLDAGYATPRNTAQGHQAAARRPAPLR